MGIAAIEVKGLAKAYGPVRAVAGVDLTIAAGEVFALLGPNGAGKTTTVEILEGFTARDSGTVSVLGHDPADNHPALKARIGIVAQETAADPFLTVSEMMRMIAGTYPAPRPVGEVIDLVGLKDNSNVRAGRLSGGQQRRLDVALALVGDPDLLFLDEPTTGFDPDARLEAWAMIRELRALGKTVLLTTHYMDEAQQLADRVAVIAAGRIIAQGTPDTLGSRGQAASRIRFRRPVSGPPLPASLMAGIADTGGDTILLHADDPVPLLNSLTGWALEHDVKLEGLEVTRPSLEETYLALIAGHDAGKGEAA
ncbi:MAG: type transport system ATP-binding protein [Sphingomonadales bacterium]|jgi:ABC-2 type transport system ATP-binding protein|nr:type transport system ATP-binding protein [Sphingomonadales bacterium]